MLRIEISSTVFLLNKDETIYMPKIIYGIVKRGRALEHQTTIGCFVLGLEDTAKTFLNLL